MGSYCVDSYDLDPGRTEGRNLLIVIGGGGGSPGAADGTQQKRKSSQKLFHLLLIKIVMCLVYAETEVLLLWQSRYICMMLVTCTSCIVRVNLP